MTAQKRYKGYTLVEMLVVLAIFIIIATIGFSSFYGLKDSITMNEKTLTLSQDIRFAQRSALFVERNAGDRWVYGIGIDFSTLSSDGKYKLFKWCSQFSDYGDTRTKGEFPNFDKTFPVGALNGSLPTGGYVSDDCPQGIATSELVLLSDSGDRIISGFDIDLPTSNNAVGDVGGVPVYLLFEAVSGRAFFYDASGNIINYAGDGTVVNDTVDLLINIESDKTKTRKRVVISNISGKVNIQIEKTN